MQDLAEDYQRALADISSLRAIYDAEIESLQEEVSQCKAAKAEERWWVYWVRRMGGLAWCCWMKLILGDYEWVVGMIRSMEPW